MLTRKEMGCGEPTMVQSFQDHIGAVGQYEAGSSRGGVREDIDEVLDDERLAAGEGKLAHTENDGFVHQRTRICQGDAIQPVIARL